MTVVAAALMSAIAAMFSTTMGLLWRRRVCLRRGWLRSGTGRFHVLLRLRHGTAFHPLLLGLRRRTVFHPRSFHARLRLRLWLRSILNTRLRLRMVLKTRLSVRLRLHRAILHTRSLCVGLWLWLRPVLDVQICGVGLWSVLETTVYRVRLWLSRPVLHTRFVGVGLAMRSLRTAFVHIGRVRLCRTAFRHGTSGLGDTRSRCDAVRVRETVLHEGL